MALLFDGLSSSHLLMIPDAFLSPHYYTSPVFYVMHVSMRFASKRLVAGTELVHMSRTKFMMACLVVLLTARSKLPRLQQPPHPLVPLSHGGSIALFVANNTSLPACGPSTHEFAAAALDEAIS